MRRFGKFIALVSPILAVGVAASILFVLGYDYQSAVCMEDPASPGRETCTRDSGTVSVFQNALETGDYVPLFWAGFIVVVCLVSAVSALFDRAAPIWVCAVALYVLTIMGMFSIGLFIFPLALALLASAILLTVSRLDPDGA